MNLEQLAAQLLWCGWGDAPEPEPKSYTAHARWLVEELGAGGIILFTRNLGTPEEIAALTAELRAHAPRPLLIGIDQEGGRVSRLPLPGMVFPGNMALGTHDDPALTGDVSRALGEQLAALGINVDFAPVLDVNNNPDNPIIGVRSFGEEPERVTRHGVPSVRGFQAAGVLPVLKHFPGHGDTSVDSHLDLPVQPAQRARLDAVELAPFRTVLRETAAAGTAVMSTHIRFPALDPELPSTLSPRILTGLLREELGFEGLVVTDCLEMRGIAGYWGPEEAAVLAVEAGADMLLVCHTRETQARMHAALCAAVRTGRLSEERLWESVRRIERVREQFPARAPQPERASAPEYLELEARATEACLHPVGAPRWPGLDPTLPALVTGAPEVCERLAAALREAGQPAEALPWSEGATAEQLAGAAQVVFTALPQSPFAGGKPPEAVAKALAAHPQAVVVAAREPYCLAHYPESVPRLAAWGAQRPHLAAVAKWLVG